MFPLSYHLMKKGLLNFPGGTDESKKVAEELLLKDAEVHHCFFNEIGFHNHLSHHILAAYDLGSPAGHLQKIYDAEAPIQRPRLLEEKDKSITVNKENWVQYLGNTSAYGAFLTFISNEIKELGVEGALEKYLFSEDANANGAKMLSRLLYGIMHPLIQIGYGIEFGNDMLVTTGLSQTAMSRTTADLHTQKSSASGPNITLLELLRQVYASEILEPGPYHPDAFVNTTKHIFTKGGAEEIGRLCAQYHISDHISDTRVAQKTEEIIWTSVLLTFGTGRKGEKPRIDFFLMHILTSSLFLRPFCAILKNPAHKAALIRTYIPVLVLTVITRGRPRINPELLMSYTDVPRPPREAKLTPAVEAIGNPVNDKDYNPWPAMIEGVRYHSDAHTLKTMRVLAFAAQHFGDKRPGDVVGVYQSAQDGSETHAGMAKVDGTLFVRAAGMLMDVMSWSGHGQKEGQWDRSGLGWDEAWVSND